MTPTIWNLLSDNAVSSTLVADALNNTTDPIAFAAPAGQGSRFANPSGGAVQPVGLWSRSTKGDNPFADPNFEKAYLISRSTDILTLDRPNALAHAGICDIVALDFAENLEQVQDAVTATESAITDLETDKANALRSISSESADFTLGLTDDVVLVDTSGGDVEVTLPPADALFVGQSWRLYNNGTGVLSVVVDGGSGDTLLGTASTSDDNKWLDIVCVSASSYQIGTDEDTGGGGGGGAPDDATYWTSSASVGLSAENNVGALSDGLLKHASGVPALAISGTDYSAPGHTHTASNVTDFNEAAQDAVGAALTDTATLDLTYNDGANTISGNVLDSPTVGGATAAQVRDRATHTGVQVAATISDFTTAVQAVAAEPGANPDITSMTGLTGPLQAPTQVNDASGNEVVKFGSTGSAVNELTITNAATGNAPAMSATGGDADIDLNLVPKGTGKVKAGGNEVYRAGGTDVPVTDGGTGSSTASGARGNLSAAASGANSDITSLTALSTPLSVAQGGTAGATAAAARAALSAAVLGANGDITSLTGLTTALSIAQGGTAGTTAAAARSALSAAVLGANGDITSLTGLTTPLSVAQGGTASTTASAARTALGLAIGTDVQAYSARLLRLAAAATVLTDAATVAIDFSLSTKGTLSTANSRTMGNPTNAVDEDEYRITVKNTSGGSITLVPGSNYRFGTDITAIPAITTGKKQHILLRYDATDGKFDVIGCTTGF